MQAGKLVRLLGGLLQLHRELQCLGAAALDAMLDSLQQCGPVIPEKNEERQKERQKEEEAEYKTS